MAMNFLNDMNNGNIIQFYQLVKCDAYGSGVIILLI